MNADFAEFADRIRLAMFNGPNTGALRRGLFTPHHVTLGRVGAEQGFVQRLVEDDVAERPA
jgi:hypothetical protein